MSEKKHQTSEWSDFLKQGSILADDTPENLTLHCREIQQLPASISDYTEQRGSSESFKKKESVRQTESFRSVSEMPDVS